MTFTVSNWTEFIKEIIESTEMEKNGRAINYGRK